MILLLTGQQGSGKSTVAMNLARRLAQAGILTGGLICPGIFEHKRKIGILGHYPGNGHEEPLGMECTIHGKPVPETIGPDTFRYGRWEFRQSALAKADDSIIRDIEASLFVFVDEIGPLELDYGLGMSRTLARLDAENDRSSCTIVVCARQDLAQQLTGRWPQSRPVELAAGNPSAITWAENCILMAAGIHL